MSSRAIFSPRRRSQRPPQRQAARSRDWGRTFARLLCLLFALIGAIPLSGGLLLRSAPLTEWAAGETSRLLRSQLGLSATYEVELSLIPLRLAVKDLTVPDKYSDKPAISAELIAVSPRFFSLLAGRIDVGDIELENSELRLDIRDGVIQNIAHNLPESSGDSPELTRAPFRSIAITNANFDITSDGNRLRAEGIDVDAFVEHDLVFDVALRAVGAHLRTAREVTPKQREDATETEVASYTAYDEDRLCALDLRAEISPQLVDIRRLALIAAVDTDDAADTEPQCVADDPNRLALRLSQLKIWPPQEDDVTPQLRGHVMARAPLVLLDRLSPSLKGRGWAGFSGTVALDGQTRLPEVSGRVSGADMNLSGYNLSDSLRADVLVSNDVVHVSKMDAHWGNGDASFTDIVISPFEKDIPLSIGHASTHEIDFPGVMRDVVVTDHSWVDWNFGNTEIDKVRGTIWPFYIDGAFDGKTHDFVVWDRGFDDPARHNMLGIPRADVKGRFRAHTNALEFYDCNLNFGTSSLPVDLVSVGFFPQTLIVRLEKEGGDLELADISPIAGIDLSGKTHIFVDLKGPMTHPILKGDLSAEDLKIAGFPAGTVEHSDVHFEPLFVEFTNLKGQKGGMLYELPQAKLDFDGPASVEFTGQVHSSRFIIREFLDVFHFDEDPRFDGIDGEGSVSARIRYVMGGPEDGCDSGRLLVEGSGKLTQVALMNERFSGGDAEFYFDWFDIEAGLRGMRVDLPSLTLRKGSGSIFGTAQVQPGGRLRGDLLGTQIPITHIDSLGRALEGTDGFITGSGQLGGTADNPAVDLQISTSELKHGDVTLAPSIFNVRMVPAAGQSTAGAKRSGCGYPILQPYDPEAPEEAGGSFEIAGSLFQGQVKIEQASISRGPSPSLSGRASLKRTDLKNLVAFFAGDIPAIGSAELSGELDARHLSFANVFDSDVDLTLHDLQANVSGVQVSLEGNEAKFHLGDHAFRSKKLALWAKADGEKQGTLDASLLLDDKKQLDASFTLRPTDLDVFGSSIPGLDRASGQLAATIRLQGPVQSPTLSGGASVENGEFVLSALPTPLTGVNIALNIDRKGIRIDKGSANWGGGTVQLRGNAPFAGGAFNGAELDIKTRRVRLPLDDGVQVEFDSDLKLNIPAPSLGKERTLPALSGTIDVIDARYEKPMSITADITDLTARGDKTEVSGYDIDKDALALDVLLRSSRPLTVRNELVVATLRLDPAGLRITGTDQRYGAVGTVEVQAGGQVFLRRNEFELQSGLVRFNDPTRLHPEVDVSAVTEYRRYDNFSGQSGAQASTTSVTQGSGNWRILMHAYGPPENLKVDLTSDPPLAQDDIFLLLTVGLTRTELDQSRNSGVGSSVALEALGTLSGAESAVTDTVPVDEFRFGSTFSSRSGRTEPTVTIGKRLSDRIRASVTTSLSETSEVRSNVEYRATDNVSLEGSYDNARNVASAGGGNIGGDVRWRLEFQ